MPGAKGKSGGPRPGAGRKGSQARAIGDPLPVLPIPKPDAAPKKPDVPQVISKDADSDDLTIGDVGELDPLAFLEAVMRNPLAADGLRVRAAVTVAQYRHTRTRDGGKKEAKQEAAKKASTGRFSAAAPPSKS